MESQSEYSKPRKMRQEYSKKEPQGSLMSPQENLTRSAHCSSKIQSTKSVCLLVIPQESSMAHTMTTQGSSKMLLEKH